MGIFNLFKKKQIKKYIEHEDNHDPNQDGGRLNNAEIPAESIAIFIWSQDGNAIKQNDQYVKYLTYEFNIVNPMKFHQLMIDDGYLQKADIYRTLNTFFVPELKEMCIELNIPKNGRKAEIIERIVTNASESFKDNVINSKLLYVLSPKGKAFVEKNYQYIYLHKHGSWCIPVEEFKIKEQENPNIHYKEIIFKILNDRLNANICNALQNNQAITEYFSIYQFLKEENQSYTKYLANYIYSTFNSNWFIHTAISELEYSNKTKQEIIQEYLPSQIITKNNMNLLTDLVNNLDSNTLNDIPNLKFRYPIVPPKMFSQILYEIKENVLFDSQSWNDLYNNRVIEIIKSL